MYQNAVIIPALNPSEQLVGYVSELIDNHFERIVVVDDGSDARCQATFDALRQRDEVVVLRHAVNLGKGRALKNAFNYVLTHWADSISGVITADSDGQHTVTDIIRLQNELENQKAPALILGTRSFHNHTVPPKSRWGNQITSVVFALLYGRKVRDTQTGLRAIPKEYLYAYLDLPGERFEYEMNMLIYAVTHQHQLSQMEIQTVYFDRNSETHFKPFLDSMRIYRVILAGFFRFVLSSASAAIIDLLLFDLFTLLLGGLSASLAITISTIAARILSSLYNFTVNRKAVFGSCGNKWKQAGKYYTLCIVQMLVSAGAVVWLDRIFAGNKLIEKIIVDGILFLISYQVQRLWVFKEKRS